MRNPFQYGGVVGGPAFCNRGQELADLLRAAENATEAKNLFELFAPVRGLLTDEEIDTLFARNPSPSRPVDLS